MTTLDWWAYYKNYLVGIRRYIMKEPLDTLEAAKKRQNILEIFRVIFFSVLYFSISIIVWMLLQKIFTFTSTPCVDSSSVEQI
ncbi:hypothetical protein WA026_002616 [Henosepilachna vigintioctopunctata]|uniref:Uncharacterized protein n=1 Tax=Henosepilachna vigintioctopunctata TaxID=420089 RepID=A0AAW1U0Q1_9CUCU